MATEPKHIREIRRKLVRYGIDVTGVEMTRGSHLRVHLRAGSKTTSMIHSCTSGDFKADQAFVSRARRAFRA